MTFGCREWEPEIYELPDSTIIVRDERIKCPEALFNPNLIFKEKKGLAQECYDLLLDIEKNYNCLYWD
jgi:hypothetical protein